MNGRIFLCLCFSSLLAVLSACKRDAPWRLGTPLPKERVKICVIHPNKIDTSAYDYAHYLGTVAMQRQLGLADSQIIRKVDTLDMDVNVSEGAIRDCVVENANIVIAPSWGYMNVCEKMAKEFPNVVFTNATGIKSNGTNFTNYAARLYQARYLSGIVAGLNTKTGKIGYVAAMGKDNSEVTRGLNAFALGVERVNPKARVYVRVIYGWFDPLGETEAAELLIKQGVDVVAQHTNTSSPQIAAEKAGVLGIGFNTDMSIVAPKAVLTSVELLWGAYYVRLVESVIDGTFTTKPYFGSMLDGVVDLSPIAENLAVYGTASKVAEEREKIENGLLEVFYGELKTNDGKVVGELGKVLPDETLLNNMNWYYHTVIEVN